MAFTFAITGLHGGMGADGPGSVPLRFEFHKFVDPRFNRHAGVQVNLFLLALERMQNAPRTERLSWFQIAGIHGQPFADWDGARAAVNTGDNRQWLGYCTHASILFPTWHRAYMLLVEQAVFMNMVQVFNQYPPAQQQQMQKALETWRFPYWDWALRRVAPDGQLKIVLPDLLKQQYYNVSRPNTGFTQQIENPLYRYRFPIGWGGRIVGISDQTGPSFIPYSSIPYTLRHPPPFQPQFQSSWYQGLSNNDALENTINGTSPSFAPNQASGRQLAAGTYALFANQRSYPPFSNTNNRQPGVIQDLTSLESIHNNVHAMLGGMTGGHMLNQSVSAFDPIFWLHHGNVERLLCIWQELNPERSWEWRNEPWIGGTIQPWFSNVAQVASDAQGGTSGGTWTTPFNAYETSTSPLTPFHKDSNGSFFTSDDVRWHRDFGYTFEELRVWLPENWTNGVWDFPRYLRGVRASLNEKYGWAVPGQIQLRRVTALRLARDAGEPVDDETISMRMAMPSTEERHFREYVVNVRVDRFALDGASFVVHIFLGDVPSNCIDWHTADTHVGIVTVFGGTSLRLGTCSNCELQAEQEQTRMLTGQLSITPLLLDVIESGAQLGGLSLSSLEKEDVAPFLKANLHWRVSTVGANEHDINGLPTLRVGVAVGKATVPDDDGELVSYNDFEDFGEPTVGRLRGFNRLVETF